jgi:superfamily II DNA or RNA helicase
MKKHLKRLLQVAHLKDITAKILDKIKKEQTEDAHYNLKACERCNSLFETSDRDINEEFCSECQSEINDAECADQTEDGHYSLKACERCNSLFEQHDAGQVFCKKCINEQNAAGVDAALGLKNCAYCTRKFKPKNENQRFCTQSCSSKAEPETRSKREVPVPPSSAQRVGPLKGHVNAKPSARRSDLSARQCEYCKKTFKPYTTTQRFCSLRCSTLSSARPEMRSKREVPVRRTLVDNVTDRPTSIKLEAPNTNPVIGEAVTFSPQREKNWIVDTLKLYPWQQRAYNRWQISKYRGIIEAVTGAGKTRVAIAAAAFHLEANWKVVTIVPTIELMNQWYKKYEKHLLGDLDLNVKIGKLGGGSNASCSSHDVVIAVAASASKRPLLAPGRSGLIIADECHHYGAQKWSRALQEGFERRLGLTATYEREDDGCEKYTDPYFNQVVYRLGYEEALADGVIADFKIAYIGARFNQKEKRDYESWNKTAYKYRNILIEKYRLPEEPFGQFMLKASQLSRSSEGEASRMAGFYLNAFSKRRKITALAKAKLDRYRELQNAIKNAEKTIVFAQTREAAQRAVNLMGEAGISGAVLDATMDMEARKKVFAGFEDGTHDLVAAPKLLDEGVDVPSADLAIIIASSRSRRQLVQRMGRVIRRKKDGRIARIAVLYIEGTAEDPNNGAHADFMESVTDAAADVKIFDSGHSSKVICAYLNDMRP